MKMKTHYIFLILLGICSLLLLSYHIYNEIKMEDFSMDEVTVQDLVDSTPDEQIICVSEEVNIVGRNIKRCLNGD